MRTEHSKRRAGGQPGALLPPSAATRRRLLADMLARAQQGDTAAAESLVRLSLEREAARHAQRQEAAQHA